MTISVIGAGNGNEEQRRQQKHYADIRHRLMFGRPRVAIEPTVALIMPASALPRPRLAPVAKKPATVPLDMLSPPSARFLIKLAALRHRMPVRKVIGKERVRPVVLARRDAIGLVFQHTQLSLPGVGRHFHQDHTTILHALRKAGKNHKLVDLRPAIAAETRPKMPEVAKPAPATMLQKVVRRAYEHNIPPSVVAGEYGCNPKSVKVIAHRLGLTRSGSQERADG